MGGASPARLCCHLSQWCYYTARVTWSFVHTPMQDFSMKTIPAAEPEHTYFSLKMTPSRGSMVQFSLLPKTLSSWWVMASAAKSELAALFITAQEMIPHRQTLIYMGWPQPKTPIQTDKSTAAGVTNNTIVPRRSKMMDMRFWWLRCRESQYPRPVSVLLGCRIKKLWLLPWSPSHHPCKHLE